MSFCVLFCKQKTAYEMRISDWSSDVCSSDLRGAECGFYWFSEEEGGYWRIVRLVRSGLTLSIAAQRLHRRTPLPGSLMGTRSPHRSPNRRAADRRAGCRRAGRRARPPVPDRKSVGWGKSVSVRVDFGG